MMDWDAVQDWNAMHERAIAAERKLAMVVCDDDECGRKGVPLDPEKDFIYCLECGAGAEAEYAKQLRAAARKEVIAELRNWMMRETQMKDWTSGEMLGMLRAKLNEMEKKP